MKCNLKRGAVSLIERLRRGEKSIPKRIKRYYKYKKFEKYAKIGENLNICVRSNCTAEEPGHITIGNHCEIYGTVQSMGKGKISIGDHTAIYERSIVGSIDSITIGSCVIISNEVHIFDNNNHPTSPEAREKMCLGGFHTDAWHWKHAASKPIVIEDNVWIGERSAVLKGVTIGRGAIVASHSVVTKDVEPYTIVAGNPARKVKEIRDEKS